MQENNFLKFTKQVVHNMPVDWLTLTTHRLDIYNESKAKTEFLEQFEVLFAQNNSEEKELMELPTAYDYIRLGHPLSCVLEWTLARTHKLNPQSVISFSSETAPVLSVLRTNLLKNKNTLVAYFSSLPKGFDEVAIKKIYGYKFETQKVSNRSEIKDFEGSVLYISEETDDYSVFNNIDFHVSIQSGLGSMLFILGENKDYVSDIQHVRRRETIAMTPSNSLIALNILLGNTSKSTSNSNRATNKSSVIASIKEIEQGY